MTAPAHGDLYNHARRVVVTVAIVFGAVLGVLVVGYATHVFMLLFSGILLALFLRGISDWLSRRTGLHPGVSLALVVAGLLAALVLTGWLLAPQVSAQAAVMVQQMPVAISALSEWLSGYSWGRELVAQIGDELTWSGAMLGRLVDTFSTSVAVLLDLAIVGFLGLYFAIDPRRYVNGVLALVPRRQRRRTREIAEQLAMTLRRWLVARFLSMIEVGVLTGVALYLIGTPLALILGILTAILNFVPYIGPVIAGVPVVLIALTVSPTHAMYALLVFTAVNLFDAYVVSPVLDQRIVLVPAGLVVAFQVLMGILVGTMGVLLATPLLAVAMVLVRELYIKGVLGNSRA